MPAPVELTIKAEDGTGPDLYRWLATDPDVRSFAAGAVPAGREVPEGTMGTGFDLLNLIVPNAIGLAGLFVSLAAFVDQRRRATGSSPQVAVAAQPVAAAPPVVVVVTGSADPQALADQIERAIAAQAAQAAQAGVATGEAPGAAG